MYGSSKEGPFIFTRDHELQDFSSVTEGNKNRPTSGGWEGFQEYGNPLL